MLTLKFGSLTSLALFAGSTFALVNPHDSVRHHVVQRGAARARNFTSRDDSGVTTGQATWFPTGLGACGTVNVPSDFIVAQNTPQYGNGENCYKQVIITAANGVQQTATITDECPPPCNYGDMDMTTGLFTAFGYTLDDGVFAISWVYADAAPAPASDPATSSTPAWTPPPSTTSEPPSTSSAPPPSTSSVPTTTSTFSTTSVTNSSASSASAATATPSTASTNTAPQTGGNLHAQSKLLVQMANIIAAGGSS